MSVCSLRVACNTRRKDQSTGEWEDKPNFFDVTVWGAQGENCARFLAKGRPVAIDGRLEWREWDTPGRPQAPGRSTSSPTPCSSSAAARTAAGNGNGGSPRGPTFRPTRATSSPPAPAPAAAASNAGDDDIPF